MAAISAINVINVFTLLKHFPTFFISKVVESKNIGLNMQKSSEKHS